MPTLADLAPVEREAKVTFDAIEKEGFPWWKRRKLEHRFWKKWLKVKQALRQDHSELKEGDLLGRIPADTVLGPNVEAALFELNEWWLKQDKLIREWFSEQIS